MGSERQNSQINDTLKQTLAALPESPGVYLMRDLAGQVIYVGKAVNLKRRVKSYFQASGRHSVKVRRLVAKVAKLETIVTDSEVEALTLECNLIKHHLPRYNILLKDDKSYPYIKVTVWEDFPRIYVTHRRGADGGRYFGPYTDSGALQEMMQLLKALFPLRTCKHLHQQTRPCLQYHIKRCLAPCARLVGQEDYAKMVQAACQLLEGQTGQLERELKAQMRRAVATYAFEEAARLRDQLRALEKMADAQNQKAIIDDHSELDVVGLAQHGASFCVQIFLVRQGKLIGREHYFMVSEGVIGDDLAGVTDATDVADFANSLTSSATQNAAAQAVLAAFLQQYYSQQVDDKLPRQIVLGEGLKAADRALIARWLNHRVHEVQCANWRRSGGRRHNNQPQTSSQPCDRRQSGSRRRGEGCGCKLVWPQRGTKRELLQLANHNAQRLLAEQLRKKGILQQADHLAYDAAVELAMALGLGERGAPLGRIDCFDISHTQGTNTIASMVVFRGGLASKKDYRYYKIVSTEEGRPDDFQAMREVVYRRYHRLSTQQLPDRLPAQASRHTPQHLLDCSPNYASNCSSSHSFRHSSNHAPNHPPADALSCLSAHESGTAQERSERPDLIVIDGGKGQLASALAVLQELNLAQLPVIGLAKREEEIFLPGREDSLILRKDSAALQLVQQIRDEAHRFAITRHRQLRAKRSLVSSLDRIPGVGPKRKAALYQHFKSLAAIKAASLAALSSVPGISPTLARAIYSHLAQDHNAAC